MIVDESEARINYHIIEIEFWLFIRDKLVKNRDKRDGFRYLLSISINFQVTIDFPAIWLVEIDALWSYSYWLPSDYSFLYFFQNGRRRTFSIFTILTEDKIERIKDCLIPQKRNKSPNTV